MSNPLRLLAILVPAAMLAVAAPSTAVAAGTPTATAPQSNQARFGRSFRPPSSRARYRPRARAPYGRRYRRPNLVGGIFRALGIAYLFHALFGWGPGGGSPFGLLLLAGLVLLLLRGLRRRHVAYRRTAYY